MLWNYGLPSIMRSFKSTYVVVDSETARWYKSEESFTSGEKPAGSIRLYTVATNSRLSVIKQTAACWPFITKEDCPKATEISRHYFGIQYFDDRGSLAQLVLAANSLEEKRQWVQHIAQLIPLHIPADAPMLQQGQLYIEMAENTLPFHTKTVLSGEAPR